MHKETRHSAHKKETNWIESGKKVQKLLYKLDKRG